MTITDPFAQTTATSTADPAAFTFDDPNEIPTDFVRIEDVDGRTIAIFAKEVRQEKGTQGMYDKVIADVVILDGPAFGLITEVPMLVRDMHLSADRVVKAVRPNVGTGRPIMGKVDSKRSTKNAGGKAYDLKPVDAATKNRYAPAVMQVVTSQIDG
jgi:hypothetical protein